MRCGTAPVQKAGTKLCPTWTGRRSSRCVSAVQRGGEEACSRLGGGRPRQQPATAGSRLTCPATKASSKPAGQAPCVRVGVVMIWRSSSVSASLAAHCQRATPSQPESSRSHVANSGMRADSVGLSCFHPARMKSLKACGAGQAEHEGRRTGRVTPALPQRVHGRLRRAAHLNESRVVAAGLVLHGVPRELPRHLRRHRPRRDCVAHRAPTCRAAEQLGRGRRVLHSRQAWCGRRAGRQAPSCATHLCRRHCCLALP